MRRLIASLYTPLLIGELTPVWSIPRIQGSWGSWESCSKAGQRGSAPQRSSLSMCHVRDMSGKSALLVHLCVRTSRANLARASEIQYQGTGHLTSACATAPRPKNHESKRILLSNRSSQHMRALGDCILMRDSSSVFHVLAAP